jgi:phosphoribosylaminoimidazole-succinocarboxamide synthase
MKTVYSTNFPGIKEFRRGKVRDVYEIGDKLLVVATDRVSAFDVVMDSPIPEKGRVLSQISAFWFEKTKHIVNNHFITNKVADYPAELQPFAEELEGRSMLVKKCKMIPLECIVRGYIAGSGWKEYKRSQTVCSIPLPAGLLEHSKLPEPIFTPSTKAEEGHDENISPEQAAKIIGEELAAAVAEASLKLYYYAAEYLESVGLILCDTKFEFGLDENNVLTLIDEALTPDSSRFWLKSEYAPGRPLVNFDKQALRDYLESINWNKMPPPPPLPDEIINKTTEKYLDAWRKICK